LEQQYPDICLPADKKAAGGNRRQLRVFFGTGRGRQFVPSGNHQPAWNCSGIGCWVAAGRILMDIAGGDEFPAGFRQLVPLSAMLLLPAKIRQALARRNWHGRKIMVARMCFTLTQKRRTCT